MLRRKLVFVALTTIPLPALRNVIQLQVLEGSLAGKDPLNTLILVLPLVLNKLWANHPEQISQRSTKLLPGTLDTRY